MKENEIGIVVHEGTALQGVEDVFNKEITAKLTNFGEELECKLEEAIRLIEEHEGAKAIPVIKAIINNYAYLDD